MKKFYFLLLIILLNNGVQASEKDKIIENLKSFAKKYLKTKICSKIQNFKIIQIGIKIDMN